MKPPLRQLIRERQVEALVFYCRESFGITLSSGQVRAILDQAVTAGGPPDQPWGDGTWKVWLKGKTAQAPPDAPADATPEPTPRRDLAAALNDVADPVLATNGFEVCQVGPLDDLAEEFPDEVWGELFPVVAALGKTLADEFAARGGAFLGPAPLASWLLARLEYLGLGGVEEENDLGGYVTDFLIREGGTPVGVVSIVADSGEVELSASGRTARVGPAFVALLVRDVTAVARCELEVNAAELGCTNTYGWTSDGFLGAWNGRG